MGGSLLNPKYVAWFMERNLSRQHLLSVVGPLVSRRWLRLVG